MARRLADLIGTTTPLSRSEIILVQQGGVDKQATVQDVLNETYLNGLFDTRLAIKTTDNLSEGTNKYFFNHNNTNHTETYMMSTDITYELLDINGDIGTSSGQLAIGNHNHDSVYIRRDGTYPMSGSLEVGIINLNSVDPSDTATIFGTHSGGNSKMHIRIGNGVGDKLQIESWNGSTATSLLEIGQTTVVIKGDLQVTGSTISVDSTNVNIADNEITLNSNVSGAPSLNASVVINRGSSTNAKFEWNESSDRWQIDPGIGSSYDVLPTIWTSTEPNQGDMVEGVLYLVY